ncbi:MAG: deiodinase [Acidobacteria bacterium]|nr:deiodinase [Acidobacteriota bacterium]
MYERYRSSVQFFLIYIREAHATDGWQVPANVRDSVLLESAKSMDQKEVHATSCVRKLDIKFPTLVDNMDNAVELAYNGWPDRLYLISNTGKVLFKGAPGPKGFKPPELEAAIKAALFL